MNVVLVSGASGGIGRATAWRFARAGAMVYAGVRSPGAGAELERAAADSGLQLRSVALDVVDDASVAAVRARVLGEAGRIDVLVNNAGIHRLGALEDIAESELRRMMETNFFGAVRLTRAFLPAMRGQRGGCVVMVSSVGGILSRAGDAGYCASKWALEAAAEALRFEVERWGIRVVLVEPGATRTGISAGFEELAAVPPDSPYRPLLAYRARQARRACAGGEDPEQVALGIHAAAIDTTGRLRHPVGAQAQHLCAEVGTWSDAERAERIRRAAGTGWWSAGADGPSQEP
jgi:NAD(P)-dependent dehydrogenase (short-subunit alcohol dehydrogenase family)